MIRDKKEKEERGIEIDLSGPDGNAYVLMGYAKQYAKQLDYTQEKIDAMLIDMRSSDYEHLLQVFEDNFGEYVTLWR